MTLDEKIKEAADAHVKELTKAYMSDNERKKLIAEGRSISFTTFTDGANFMRELMQGEVDRLTFDRDNLSQSFFKLQQSASDGIILLEKENEKLREQLAVVDSLLKELSDRHLWSQHCGECICQPHINVKNYLSKIQGGAE